MMCSFFFSHSKKQTFCVQKNRRKKFPLFFCPPLVIQMGLGFSPFWTCSIEFPAICVPLITTEEEDTEEEEEEEAY